MAQTAPVYKSLDTDLSDYIEALDGENTLALEYFLDLIREGCSNEEAYRRTLSEFGE